MVKELTMDNTIFGLGSAKNMNAVESNVDMSSNEFEKVFETTQYADKSELKADNQKVLKAAEKSVPRSVHRLLIRSITIGEKHFSFSVRGERLTVRQVRIQPAEAGMYGLLLRQWVSQEAGSDLIFCLSAFARSVRQGSSDSSAGQ